MQPEVHNQLSAIRRSRGLGAAQLALRAGVSRQTIYAIEAGSFIPNTEVALKLSRELEVSVEVLFSLYARQIRNIVTTTGVMVTSFNCEDPLAYFIYAYNIPTPPVTTPFGDVTTGIYPSLTGIPVIFDGVGAFGLANGSVRTNASGAYTRVQTGLGGLIGSGYTFVTQAYLVSYWPPRISNTWTTTL